MATSARSGWHAARLLAGSAVRWRIDRLWLTCCVAAAVLLVLAAFLPLWRMTLKAPQYPAGLHITAYGTRMEGDIAEVNDLNHYIGAQPIEPDELRELDLFPFALGGLIVALLVGAVIARRRLLRGLLMAAVWAVPVGLLIDIQWWLYQIGHDLDRTAPMRALVPTGFTPKVVGTTRVINFHSVTMVSVGFWLMVAAAVLVSVGPSLIRFMRNSWNNTGTGAGSGGKAAAALVLLLGLAALAGPRHVSAAASGSISGMIAAAAPGDTITVPAGTYHEQILIDRPLILVGIGLPIIDGGGRGDVVVIAADGVTIRGFVIQGSARDVSDEPAGIRVTGNRATIEDNRLQNVLYGIALAESSGHTVRNNSVSSMPEFPAERRGHALYLWQTDGNVIEGNTVDQVKDGIFLGFATHNRIERNRVTRARYGIHYMYANDNVFVDNVFRDNVAGGAIMFSRNITLRGNEFAHNRSAASGYGLLFKDVDDLEMVDNLIHHNRLGITMEGAPHTPGAFVTVTHNLIAFNQAGLEMSTTTGATFTDNSFVGNLEQVVATGGSLSHHNTWTVGERGNYWDDYQGYDANGNGIGDIPFEYTGTLGGLIQRDAAVRAYAFTPAQSALELAANWFPSFRPDPQVVDRAPLMAPTLSLPTATGAGGRLGGYVLMATLAGVPLLLFRAAGRAQGSRWQRS